MDDEEIICELLRELLGSFGHEVATSSEGGETIRRYREATGSTPAKALERLRVEAAQRQLCDSRDALKRIATRCGFGSEDTMRRSFLRIAGVAPQDYRRRFSP